MRSLSAGQQRRVGLARMILSAAPLWLMDEPFTNLDKDGHVLVTDLVNEHLAAGGACVLASHQAVSIEAPTHRIGL
jgi:heme exporter protein A